MDNAQQKFFEEFSSRVNDKVQSIEMINIQANNETFEAMKLVPQAGTNLVWGLLVVCEHSFYFYAHPYESMMMSMFRAASQGEAPKEQFFSFDAVKNFVIVEREKKWYNIFFNSTKFVLDVTFEIEGKTYSCCFNTQSKAADVAAKIKALLK